MQRKLETQLTRVFEHHGVSLVHRGKAAPGSDAEAAAADGLEGADLVLLLVSSDYLSSNVLWKEALSAVKNGSKGARVIALRARSADVRGTPLAGLRWLPPGEQALSNGSTLASDSVYAAVAEAIHDLLHLPSPGPKASPALSRKGAAGRRLWPIPVAAGAGFVFAGLLGWALGAPATQAPGLPAPSSDAGTATPPVDVEGRAHETAGGEGGTHQTADAAHDGPVPARAHPWTICKGVDSIGSSLMACVPTATNCPPGTTKYASTDSCPSR